MLIKNLEGNRENFIMLLSHHIAQKLEGKKKAYNYVNEVDVSLRKIYIYAEEREKSLLLPYANPSFHRKNDEERVFYNARGRCNKET